MITDIAFSNELGAALKRQGIKKADRINTIAEYMKRESYERDSILDDEECKAAAVEELRKIKKHIPSEFKEQCDFVAWFKSEHPAVVIMSIRNGGTRTPGERAQQVMEGLHAGATDLYIPEWHLWIEFKRIKGGVLSEKQETFRDYVLDVCGDSWILAVGCEDGKKKLSMFLENRK